MRVPFTGVAEISGGGRADGLHLRAQSFTASDVQCRPLYAVRRGWQRVNHVGNLALSIERSHKDTPCLFGEFLFSPSLKLIEQPMVRVDGPGPARNDNGLHGLNRKACNRW